MAAGKGETVRAAWASTVLVCVLCGPPVRASPPSNPQAHVLLAAQHLARVPEADRPHVVYMSYWDATEEGLMTERRFDSWWMHQLSFKRGVSLPQEVPDSGGRLVWVDLSWYGWNDRAWSAVARRDPFTREPWVTTQAAEELRRLSGYGEVRQDPDGTRPVLTMVNARWFRRDTLETRRSTSYYDLLFARWRFPEKGKESYEAQEKYYDFRTGQWKYRQTTQVRERDNGTTDFPATVEDWDRAFGVDLIKTFGKEREAALDFGAIVKGGRDYPDGSIVALSNRLLVTLQGPFGAAMRTYDVEKTAGPRDYSETLIFKGGTFKKGDGADAVFDAGELLAYLPNGGQAGMLIDGKGKRVEVAGGGIANDHADRDERGRIKLNPGVRTYASCIICHAPAGGFIPPRDQEEEDRKLGIRRKFLLPRELFPGISDEDYARKRKEAQEREQRYREFFEDWADRIEGYTKPYQKLVQKTTAHPSRKDVKGWTGSEVGQLALDLRNQYDAPVGPERAARELGIPVGAYKFLASRSPKHRLNQMVQDKAIPSVTWETDDFKEMGALLSAYRDDPTYRRLCQEE